MTPTPMFRTFVEYFRLDAAQATVWWMALGKAQWSEARSWAADVRYFDIAFRYLWRNF